MSLRNVLAGFALVFSFIATQIVSGQTVEVVKQGEKISVYGQDFEILEPGTDTTQYTFVATIKASGGQPEGTLQRLFFALKDEGMRLGGNTFRIKSFQHDGELILVLDVLYGAIQILEDNIKRHPKNVVFIFGGEIQNNDLYTCRVDNKKVEFKSGTYLKYEIPPNGELKVSKGGLTGMAAWFGWKEGRPAITLSLSGAEVLGGGVSPTGAGIGFTTGSLNKIDNNLGYLYTRLLKQSN